MHARPFACRDMVLNVIDQMAGGRVNYSDETCSVSSHLVSFILFSRDGVAGFVAVNRLLIPFLSAILDIQVMDSRKQARTLKVTSAWIASVACISDRRGGIQSLTNYGTH